MTTSKNKNCPTHKPCFFWHKNRKHGYEFAKKLLPHLKEKKNQCLLFVSFFETICRKTRSKIIKDLKEEKEVKNLVKPFDVDALKSIKQHIEPIRQDFIYLAGFIDAECHLGIQHYKPKDRPNTVYKVIIQCNNTKSPIFYWLKNRFGGSCHFIDRKSKDPTRSDQILWKLTGRSVYNLLKNILPFLRYKRPVAEKLIEFFETTMPNGGNRHSKAFKEAYQKLSKIRESIVSKVHHLNRKGL